MKTILPKNVFTLLVNESVAAQAQHTSEIMANIAHTNNLLRVKTVDGISTLDPVSARAVDKVLNQPTAPAENASAAFAAGAAAAAAQQ